MIKNIFLILLHYLLSYPILLILVGLKFDSFGFLALFLLVVYIFEIIFGTIILGLKDVVFKHIENERKIILLDRFRYYLSIWISLSMADAFFDSISISITSEIAFILFLYLYDVMTLPNKEIQVKIEKDENLSKDVKQKKNMRTRTNEKNELTITIEWLEKEIEQHHEPYFVIQGFYDSWDSLKDEKSPNLETILNFMYQKGYHLVSVQPMGNPNCKEMVFIQS